MGDGTLILLDTHAVLWSMADAARLSVKARHAIEEARREEPVYVASITLLEIARLTVAKRIVTPATLDALLSSIETDFTVLPITAAVAAATTRFPASYPRDPADRIIGATALVHGATLITADERIRKAKAVRTLW
jgi:PIN domain nuclease of toxin-antitoxin system